MRNASPEEVLGVVMEALKAHRGTAAQSDDITMICFKRS
jgi:sigma-B regulation protein RsbU (phosphoserine phosphatase)